MKRTIFVLLSVVALAMTTGCLHRHCRENACQGGSCPQGEACPAEACPSDPNCPRCKLLRGCCLQHRNRGGQEAAAPAPGPTSAAVAYPYYNLRGPRDFLERNPQSIGP
jgi:hypothetical protein